MNSKEFARSLAEREIPPSENDYALWSDLLEEESDSRCDLVRWQLHKNGEEIRKLLTENGKKWFLEDSDFHLVPPTLPEKATAQEIARVQEEHRQLLWQSVEKNLAEQFTNGLVRNIRLTMRTLLELFSKGVRLRHIDIDPKDLHEDPEEEDVLRTPFDQFLHEPKHNLEVIERLLLRNANINDESLDELLDVSEKFTELRTIDIEKNAIIEQGILLLLEEEFSNLNAVYMDDNPHSEYVRHRLDKLLQTTSLESNSDILAYGRLPKSALNQSLKVELDPYNKKGELQLLLRSPFLQLRSLEIENITDKDIIALTQYPNMDNLRELELNSDLLSDEGVGTLSQWPALQNIQSLSLTSTAITTKGFSVLCKTYLPHLEMLNVNASLGKKGITALIQSELQKINHLHITDFAEEENTIAQLIKAPWIPQLKSLSISRTKLGKQDVKSISKMTGLQKLHIWNCNVGNKGFSQLLGLPNLEHLIISSNAITILSMLHDAFENISHLKTLDFSGNLFGDSGVRVLNDLFNQNALPSLYSLGIDFCGMTVTGAEILRNNTVAASQLTNLRIDTQFYESFRCDVRWEKCRIHEIGSHSERL